MATQETQELAPLNTTQQAANVVVAHQPQPHPKPKIRREKPEKLFKWKLKENDGCCTSWCSAHFFLIYLLFTNITNIVIAGYHIKVLTDPYGSHEICYYPAQGAPEECVDEREFYEDAGLTQTFLIIEIVFLIIYVLITIMTFHALQKCIPWIFFTLWLFINIQIIFILIHSILTGIYWGIFALLIPMMLSCYFWMLYQLAKYFKKGGIYDQDMSTLSPAPNNYAVMYVAKPQDLAHYHANYKNRNNLKPEDHKHLFRRKMNEGFDFCCCMCTLQTWSIIWLIYMILQNILWFASSVTTTVILYDPYGTHMNCIIYSGDEQETVDCRELFEQQGLTKTFSIIACIVAGFAVIINIWCWRGLYTCNKNAFMAQVWMLFIQALFMLLFSIFTGYYFGIFALLIPLLLSCHFYDVYIVSIYCQQKINTYRIPKMQAVVVMDKPQPKPRQNDDDNKEQQPPPQKPQVIYVPAPYQQPIRYVNQSGQTVGQPIIQAVPVPVQQQQPPK